MTVPDTWPPPEWDRPLPPMCWHTIDAHENAYWSVASIALRQVLPARHGLGEAAIRRAVTRVEQTARLSDRPDFEEALQVVLDRTHSRQHYATLHQRADQLLTFAEPVLATEASYYRAAVAAFESLGVAPAAVSALRAAIDADAPMLALSDDLVRDRTPALLAQWRGERDPSRRSRIAERIATVLDLHERADCAAAIDIHAELGLEAHELRTDGVDPATITREIAAYREELTAQRTHGEQARRQAVDLSRRLTAEELSGQAPVPDPPPVADVSTAGPAPRAWDLTRTGPQVLAESRATPPQPADSLTAASPTRATALDPPLQLEF